MKRSKPLSSRLRSLRESAGFARVADLARATGVSAWTLYSLEAGRAQTMRPTTARRLGPKLGIPWPELCE